jgi:arylsulfatase A-like enzyme
MRIFLVLLALVLHPVQGQQQQQQQQDQPNMIFLLSESLDGRLLRPDSPAKIPNLRSLMNSGSIRFDSAYSDSPVCAPARSALHSGRAPHRIRHEHNGMIVNGVWNNWEGLDKNYTAFLHELLATQGGYSTTIVGKTDWTVGSHTETCELSSITFNVKWPYNISENGGWNEEDETCSSFPSISPGGSNGPSGSVYANDWKLTEEVSSFVATAKEPFYAFLGTTILHPPYGTSEFWYNLASEQPVPQYKPLADIHPCDLQASMKRGCTPSENTSAAFFNTTRIAQLRRVYLAELEELDAMIGSIITSLIKSNRWNNNTYFIFSADHGDMQLEHQMFYKMVPYDASARIPMLIASPSIVGSRMITQPVTLIDVFPTILQLGKVPIPSYADGYDLSNFFSSFSSPHSVTSDTSRPPYVSFQNHDEDLAMSWFAVTNGTFKLVQYGTGTEVPPMLFDIENDPQEQVNLASLYPDDVYLLNTALLSQIDYPSVAADVADYQLKQFKWWVNSTTDWEKEIQSDNIRWAVAFAAHKEAAFNAINSYLQQDSASITPCDGRTTNL